MKQAINTRTQEEYDALMRYYESKGVKFISGSKPTEINCFAQYGSNTCPCLTDWGLYVENTNFFIDKNVPIIPYTEFAKANIVEEPDWKALYLEGRELLQRVKDRYWRTPEMSGALGEQIETFLTKHNDLT